MNRLKRAFAAAGIAALAVAFAGCATTNRLDRFDFRGATLAAEVPLTQPAPRMHVRYEVNLDRHEPVYSALSVLTSVAKATQAEKARAAMESALAEVDVPEIIRQESFNACATALGALPEENASGADFLRALDIHEWGIDAGTPLSTVSLRMRLTANLYEARGSELVWRRELSVHDDASPAMFGLGPIVGNMVTATALSELSVDELAEGFTALGRTTAHKVSRLLREDLAAARYSS